VAMPFSFPSGETTLKLDVFLDGTVLEVFANDGAAYVSKVISPGAADFGVEVFCNENATLLGLTGWTMGSIWGAPPVAPQLTISALGANVTVTWPLNATGWTLQAANSLTANSNSWSTVSGVVSNSVTINSTLGTQFYRLITQ